MEDVMITAVLWAAAAFLLLLAIPSAIVTWALFSRKDPPNFDEDPAHMDQTPYGPWKQEILRDLAWMRRQETREAAIRAEDGVSLRADWYPGGGKKTAILMHGFRTTPLNNFCSIGRAFLEAGWNLLLPYQRGHGKSGGRGTMLGLREWKDLIQWVDWVKQETGSGEIVLYGMSMGGATVAYAADQKMPVRCLIMDCAYCLPYDQMLTGSKASDALWRLMLPLIRRYVLWTMKVDIRRDTRQALSVSAYPAFFLGGMEDKTVPPRIVRKGYDACAGEKALLLVPGAPHTLAFLAGGEEAKKQLFDFINVHMTAT